MLTLASSGPIDFITGDYLAEMNLAEDAVAYRSGRHPGWENTAWEGIRDSIDVLASKAIKVIINGGCLNPKGLAVKVASLVKEKGLGLKVAYVAGDELMDKLGPDLASLKDNLPPHLDSVNPEVVVPETSLKFTTKESVPLVSANAYLGARAIVAGLRNGADIIICGRVSDASPVIGAAWYWHDWSDSDYHSLAGALVAGHLIECTAYVTGGNFSGFTRYPLETFLEPGFPIAEIESDGSCVVTKHEGTGGLVTTDTVRCQLLYELQGNIYLHSDVKAYIDNVDIKEVGKDRVRLSGIVGKPPPPTTKAAIFYHGGYQSQMLLNATGYGTAEKWRLLKAQIRVQLQRKKLEDAFEVLEFQMHVYPLPSCSCSSSRSPPPLIPREPFLTISSIGIPEPNPRNQLRSTTYCRLFAEAQKQETLYALLKIFGDISLQHFSGFHASGDFRTAIPKPFLAYYPSLYAQDDLEESVTIIGGKTYQAGHPPKYEELEKRPSYDTASSTPISNFGPTKATRIGDLVLARSGDKGSNLNVGLFVQTTEQWEWFRSFLSLAKFKELMGEDWRDNYWLERVEFGNIFAVHFVIYGILGRGVSGSTRLDSLGKAFADFFRDKVVDIPVKFLEEGGMAKL